LTGIEIETNIRLAGI